LNPLNDWLYSLNSVTEPVKTDPFPAPFGDTSSGSKLFTSNHPDWPRAPLPRSHRQTPSTTARPIGSPDLDPGTTQPARRPDPSNARLSRTATASPHPKRQCADHSESDASATGTSEAAPKGQEYRLPWNSPRRLQTTWRSESMEQPPKRIATSPSNPTAKTTPRLQNTRLQPGGCRATTDRRAPHRTGRLCHEQPTPPRAASRRKPDHAGSPARSLLFAIT